MQGIIDPSVLETWRLKYCDRYFPKSSPASLGHLRSAAGIYSCPTTMESNQEQIEGVAGSLGL